MAACETFAYLRKIGFPFFATGIVPSTSVHHYRFAGGQIPVHCDGVLINPGDIIVADSDGVAVVPRARATESFGPGRADGLPGALDVSRHRKT